MIITAAIREEWFTAGELAVANNFKLPKRREEWLRSRTAAKQLALERGIVTDPLSCLVARPRLIIDGADSPWYVSLSHSRGWAAAALDTTPIGIDIEAIRPLDERAAHLYLTEAETAAMFGCTIPYRALHFWSAKEAAWKQRSSEFETLKQVPLALLEETPEGLRFDAATTRRHDDLVVAITALSS